MKFEKKKWPGDIREEVDQMCGWTGGRMTTESSKDNFEQLHKTLLHFLLVF